MKYYSDGFLFLSNPSTIGGGFTIINEDHQLIVNERIMKSGLTNNEAELMGVYNALKIAAENDTVSTDSNVILLWVTRWGKKKKKNARKDLEPFKAESFKLMNEKNINLIWEPREKNLAGIYNEDAGLDNGIAEPDI